MKDVNFPDLIKHMNSQTQEAQHTSNKINKMQLELQWTSSSNNGYET